MLLGMCAARWIAPGMSENFLLPTTSINSFSFIGGTHSHIELIKLNQPPTRQLPRLAGTTTSGCVSSFSGLHHSPLHTLPPLDGVSLAHCSLDHLHRGHQQLKTQNFPTGSTMLKPVRTRQPPSRCKNGIFPCLAPPRACPGPQPHSQDKSNNNNKKTRVTLE